MASVTNDRITQLILEMHKGQSQFAYFQLGVAASAMAFAIHETTGVPLDNAPWPLGLAMILWAISFALGCFGLEARQSGLASNAAYLRALQAVPAQARGALGNAIEEAEAEVGKNLTRPGVRFRWQKWTLFAAHSPTSPVTSCRWQHFHRNRRWESNLSRFNFECLGGQGALTYGLTAVSFWASFTR